MTRARAVGLLVLGAFAIVVFPWTAYLAYTLPPSHVSGHWDVLWAGFDVGVGVAAVATVATLLLRSRALVMAASVLGALLLADAWFDVLTSIGSSDLAAALGEALLGELPLAALCFWLAADTLRSGAWAGRG